MTVEMTHPDSHPTTAPEGDGASVFEITKSLTKPVSDVFDALTTTTGLSNWWTTASGSGLTGGELTFHFTSPVVMRVDRAQRPSLVTWTVLVSEPLPDWEGTTITFEVSPQGTEGSLVRFRHTGLAQLECFGECSNAWGHFLGSLVAYVETGHGAPFVAMGSESA
ncbi:MAG TPA: SRPBCC domain-containing protein [Acidimicrobiales bacterium]|nr:SRPBCC domain-containing protein [Acidimicrobiales bacterium]